MIICTLQQKLVVSMINTRQVSLTRITFFDSITGLKIIMNIEKLL